MATATDIVNKALRRIGANRIDDLDTNQDHEGFVARDLYDECRRDCLNLHNWNFAITRAQLTAGTTPTFGWDYAYLLPDDFIRLVSVHPFDDEETTVPYRLEYQDDDDRVLVTNANQIYIRYVFDLQDTNVMSAAFRDVLAFQLAREFAGALNKSTAAAELSDIAFRRKLARAKAIDGVQDYPESMAEGSWLTSRHPDTG